MSHTQFTVEYSDSLIQLIRLTGLLSGFPAVMMLTLWHTRQINTNNVIKASTLRHERYLSIGCIITVVGLTMYLVFRHPVADTYDMLVTLISIRPEPYIAIAVLYALYLPALAIAMYCLWRPLSTERNLRRRLRTVR